MCDAGVCTACTTAEEEQYYACDPCPANTVGTYIEVPDSQSAACQNCMTGGTTQGRTGMTNGQSEDNKCHCDRGWAVDTTSVSYSKDEFQSCIQCVPGTYKHWVSNPWYIQYFALTDTYACISAYADASTETGCTLDGTIPELSYLDVSQDCLQCDAGKYSNVAGATAANVCIDCEAGKFSGSAGSSACSRCLEGEYQDASGATACKACPPNSIGVTTPPTQDEFDDIRDCRCLPGYYFDVDPQFEGIECQPCPAGYKCNNNAKTACQGDTFSTGQAATCEDCPTNTIIVQGGDHTTHDSQEDCICKLGTTGPDGGECVDCVFGYYKDTFGSATCIECEAGTYSSSTSACSACMDNSFSEAGSWHFSACTCNAGYERQETLPVTTIQDLTCTLCPSDHYCVGDNGKLPCQLASSSNAGSITEDECSCNAGYYALHLTHTEAVLNEEGVEIHDDGHSVPDHTGTHKFCRLCSSKHYCVDDVQHLCPPNTLSPAGSDQVRQCLCEARNWRTNAAGVGCTRDYEYDQPYVKHRLIPQVCDVLTLDEVSIEAKISKPQDELNTDSQFIDKVWRSAPYFDQTAGQWQCEVLEICDTKGSFFYSGCEACPENIYCMVGTSYTVATHCPEHSTAAPSSELLSDCKCGEGYRRIP